MAVTGRSFDTQEIYPFYTVAKNGAIRQLPFVMVVLDGTQYYMPFSNIYDEKGRRMQGNLQPPTFVDPNQALPIAPPGVSQRSMYAVWQYPGV